MQTQREHHSHPAATQSDLCLGSSQEAINYTSIGFPRNGAAKDIRTPEGGQVGGWSEEGRDILY